MKSVGKDTALVTIDAGKQAHYAYITCRNGACKKPFKLLNNKAGLETLERAVTRFMEKQKLTEVMLGYESTSSYMLPLIHYMEQRGAKLVQVNPKHTKRVKEITDNSPGKTDQKDPIVIAQIIGLGNWLNTILPKDIFADLRHLIRERERCIEDHTRSLNRLESLVATYFPEYLQVMKGLKTKTSIYLLKEYLTPQNIEQLGIQALTKEIRKVSRSQLGADRAEALIQAAKNTIGVKEGLNSIVKRVRNQIDVMELAKKQLLQIESESVALCKKVPYAKNLESIKGIGWITVAYFLGETTDIAKYKRAAQVEKLAGLNLYEISSGTHKGNRHITKRGKGLLRKTLFFAALRMVKKGGLFHDYYQECIGKGKHKSSTLIAVTKKLIRLMFALARDQQDYNPTLSTQACNGQVIDTVK